MTSPAVRYLWLPQQTRESTNVSSGARSYIIPLKPTSARIILREARWDRLLTAGFGVLFSDAPLRCDTGD